MPLVVGPTTLPLLPSVPIRAMDSQRRKGIALRHKMLISSQANENEREGKRQAWCPYAHFHLGGGLLVYLFPCLLCRSDLTRSEAGSHVL